MWSPLEAARCRKLNASPEALKHTGHASTDIRNQTIGQNVDSNSITKSG